MKLNRITKQEAEKIIVYGIDEGFYSVSFAQIPLTIYRRNLDNKQYYIAEMNTAGFNEKGKEVTVTTFYKLDPKEAIQMLEG